MNWKVVLVFLLSFMLVFSVFAGCTQQKDEAIQNVRKMVAELPSVDEFESMDDEARLSAYTATQNAYDAFMALSAKQQEQLTEELASIEALFAYFNTLVMPIA